MSIPKGILSDPAKYIDCNLAHNSDVEFPLASARITTTCFQDCSLYPCIAYEISLLLELDGTTASSCHICSIPFTFVICWLQNRLYASLNSFPRVAEHHVYLLSIYTSLQTKYTN